MIDRRRTPHEQVTLLVLKHAARLWPMPDNPFDISQWMPTVVERPWITGVCT